MARRNTAQWLEQQGEKLIFDALNELGCLPPYAFGMTAAELVEYAKTKGRVRQCCRLIRS